MRYGDLMQPLDPAKLLLPDKMRDDADVRRYIHLLDRTMRAEKVSDPDDWTPDETEAYARDDWRAFSRLRGYTDAEIDEFAQWLALCHVLIERYGEDDTAWIGYQIQEQTGVLGLNPKEILRKDSEPVREVGASENTVELDGPTESSAVAEARERRRKALETTEGLWNGRTDIPTDGVEYQRQIRAEWDRDI